MREYIEWQDDFSVGVEVVDAQHKKLLQVINEFLFGLDGAGDHFAIARSLDELIRYTEYHFHTEQLLLENHPEFLSHLNQHWQLVKQARQIQEEFRQNCEMKADIFDFLLAWLKEHILGTDKVHFRELLASGPR